MSGSRASVEELRQEVPHGPVRVGECGREPVWRVMVVADGFDVLPSSSFRRTRALVGSACEPTERDALGADGSLLLADQWDHLCLDALAAVSTLIA